MIEFMPSSLVKMAKQELDHTQGKQTSWRRRNSGISAGVSPLTGRRTLPLVGLRSQ
jgi:hypothetical protein